MYLLRVLNSCRCRHSWRGCLLLISAVLACPNGSLLTAQENKPAKKSQVAKKPAVAKKPTVAKKPAAAKKTREPLFDEPIFGAIPPTAGNQPPTNLDETEAGRKTCEEAKAKTVTIFADRDQVLQQLLPLIPQREKLFVESQNLVVKNNQLQKELNVLNQEYTDLRKLAAKGQNVTNQMQVVKNAGDDKQREFDGNNATLNRNGQDIANLNQQILTHNQAIAKLWQDLNVSRKKWLDVRQPQRRYALGEYEPLKEMLADWLAIDNIWPEMFTWAALCEYELGNDTLAESYIDNAEKARATLGYTKSWPQGDALRGMIGARVSERRSRAATLLKSAINATKSKTDWQSHFLIGRANFENDGAAPQVKLSFERALKANPDLDWVRVWNARLQTTSTNPKVQDVVQGTQTLEAQWLKSSKNSWRLANALVLAYDAGERKVEADKLWQHVLQLAPQARHEQLTAEREAVAAKRKAAASQEPETKAGTPKKK